ncbi:hypothetical protein [Bacillus timonensis]|uniref:hypothetical protein n=1 Tax=Bacillus timonensis TaxID=1033734 RepID=UPI0002895F19|nr:hypothetical protein [Bacillus timonensis]
MLVKIYGFFIPIILFGFISTSNAASAEKTLNLDLPTSNGTILMNIQENTTNGIKFKNTSEKNYYNRIRDIVYTYEIGTTPTSYLKISKRMVDNDDYFVFTTLENHSSKPIDLTVTFPIAETGYYSLDSFDRYRTGPRINDDINADLTTNPFGLLTTYKDKKFLSNLMVGKIYHSKEITEKYEDGRQSIMRELITENQNFEIDAKKDALFLKMDLKSDGEDIMDHWLLASEKPLFESDKTYENWMVTYRKKRYKNNSWYTADGPYSKVVKSAEPAPKSQLQYARNLLTVREDIALSKYKETRERYFYDILLNSIANLKIFKGGKDFWETEYTSYWLHQKYGIEAPYIDTRHNEGVALFLEEVGRLLDFPELTNALTNYADFLVNQIENGYVVQVGPNAYLISDYFTYHQKTDKTHSSLNHVLGGMNLLLETYQKTGDENILPLLPMFRMVSTKLALTG